MQKAPLSVIILAHNEAEMLPACLKTVTWCQEVIVIDCQSDDDTAALARAAGARVISTTETSFAKRRSLALNQTQQPWLFYLDPDERVTPELAREIQDAIRQPRPDVYFLKRDNYFFGQKMSAGGWQTETIARLFRSSALLGWRGEIHESAHFCGQVGHLASPLLHFSHRQISAGLKKSAQWTAIEAKLLFHADSRPISFLTLLRKGLGEFWRRAIRQGGWRDGQVGLVEALIQAFNRILVYAQVWEKQLQPSLSKRYQHLEHSLEKAWRQSSSL